jgi:hypothetical protein
MLDEILRRMQEARALARKFPRKLGIHIQQSKNAERSNIHRRDGDFSIGEKVLLRKFVKKKNLSSKLMHYYYGPYVIVHKVFDVNFVIEAKVGKRVHKETVHIDKLKPYYERSDEEEIQSANKYQNNNGREDDDANICELKNDGLISILPNNEVKLDNISVPDRVNEHQSRYNLRRRKINQIRTIQSRIIFPSKKRGEDIEDQVENSHHHRDRYRVKCSSNLRYGNTTTDQITRSWNQMQEGWIVSEKNLNTFMSQVRSQTSGMGREVIQMKQVLNNY